MHKFVQRICTWQRCHSNLVHVNCCQHAHSTACAAAHSLAPLQHNFKQCNYNAWRTRHSTVTIHADKGTEQITPWQQLSPLPCFLNVQQDNPACTNEAKQSRRQQQSSHGHHAVVLAGGGSNHAHQQGLCSRSQGAQHIPQRSRHSSWRSSMHSSMQGSGASQPSVQQAATHLLLNGSSCSSTCSPD